MKSKTTLSLIEEVIMVLVFAIATAVCLRIFVHSNSLAASHEMKDAAVSEVRNAVEVLKQTHGDCEKAREYADASGPFVLYIDELDSGSEYLGKARVYVTSGTEEIYSLVASWQEVVK